MAHTLPQFALLSIARTIHDRVQDVKLYQRRCENLILKCNVLISALEADSGSAASSPAHRDALGEAETTLRIIYNRVTRWADLSTMRSLLCQSDIREGLEEFHRRIDTCISSYQVKLSREIAVKQDEHHQAVQRDSLALRERVEEFISIQMPKAQLGQQEASQRDSLELREKTDEVITALIHHFSGQGSLPFNSTFHTVARDIQDEIPQIQASISVHPDPTDDSQSFNSQEDAFDRAIVDFCKSLVTLELNQPIDAIARTRTLHRNSRSPYQQNPARRRSLTSLVPSWRSSSVSLSCPQIPPLNFGGNVVWHEGPIISVAPSPPASKPGSLRSRRSTIPSTANGSSPSLQHSASAGPRIRVPSQSSHSAVTGANGSVRRPHRTSFVSADGSSMRSSYSGFSSLTVPTFSHELPDYRLRGIPTLLQGRAAQSSLDMLGFSSPLDEALTTRMSGYMIKPGVQPPVIATATLEGLIHYLLLRSAEEDPEQHNAVFVGQLAFVSPIHLLGRLIRRFEEAFMCPPEVRDDIQFRVVRLINDWLQNEHVILSEDLLTRIKNFVSHITAEGYRPDGVVLHIVRGVQVKASMNLPPPPITSSYNLTTHSGPSPLELAFALAQLEAERYQNILPSEYIAHVTDQLGSCPNLLAAIELNTRINYWVQSSILDLEFGQELDSLEKRSEVKQFFIMTAKECRSIGNFSSLGAIMSALQSTTVDCLTLTHDMMPPPEQRQFVKLAKFLKPDGNYRAYRKDLQQLSKGTLHKCIPWHEVVLHDITTLLREEVRVDDKHNPPMLNFELWITLKKEAVSTLRFRDSLQAYENPSDDPQRQARAKEYLQAGLLRVRTEEDYRRGLVANSAILRANEDSLRTGRII